MGGNRHVHGQIAPGVSSSAVDELSAAFKV
jgi:hypothetical protein